jgi:chain length determinant protein (polysaccharide antigen chain regulator)
MSQLKSHKISSAVYNSCNKEVYTEISVADLWGILTTHWKWILLITLLSILAAFFYLSRAKPIFEAQAILLAPEARYVEPLNIQDINQISSDDIFKLLIGNLKSSSLRRKYFDANKKAFLKDSNRDNDEIIFQEEFNNKLKIKEGVKSEVGFVFASLEGYDQKLIAEWVNGFILLSERKTIDDLISNIEIKIVSQREKLQNQIQIAREFAKRRRQDRIALLNENIAIAQELKITNRENISLKLSDGKNIGVAVNTTEEPLYMRGVKELDAEVKALEARKEDDAFIFELRDKQEKLAQLEAATKQLQVTKTSVAAVKIDQKAYQPIGPVRPKRLLVLGMSAFLGIIVGCLAAFSINSITQKNKIK